MLSGFKFVQFGCLIRKNKGVIPQAKAASGFPLDGTHGGPPDGGLVAGKVLENPREAGRLLRNIGGWL